MAAIEFAWRRGAAGHSSRWESSRWCPPGRRAARRCSSRRCSTRGPAMKLRPRYNNVRDESGIALIIVMISILVLALLAGRFAYSMKVETTLARNANSEMELEWLGRSGVEYARWILVQQAMCTAEPYDAETQIW